MVTTVPKSFQTGQITQNYEKCYKVAFDHRGLLQQTFIWGTCHGMYQTFGYRCSATLQEQRLFDLSLGSALR